MKMYMKISPTKAAVTIKKYGAGQPSPIWILLTRYFRIRTIVHCVANLSWFCNQTSYLIFSILGQRIYHDFESIQPCILSFSYPWDMEFIMVVSPYFTSDSIFFNMYMYETKWYNVNREHNLIAVLHHEVSH
jgi:hypothetical protein